MKRILDALLDYYGPRIPWTASDAFKVLVRTIISQNTNDLNTDRAFVRLSKRFEVSPRVIAKAKVSDLEGCLRVAGLYKRKSKRLKQLAQTIIDQFGGDLESLAKLSTEEARKVLLELEGVGEKTADVLLSFYFRRSKLAIDTHVFRVSRRLGYGSKNAKYSEIQAALEAEVPEKRRLEAHLLLIQHGRNICKAPKPKCYECPIINECPYKHKNLSSDSR